MEIKKTFIDVQFYINSEKEMEEFSKDLCLIFFGNKDYFKFSRDNILIGDGLNFNGGRCMISLMQFEFGVYYANDDLPTSEKVPFKYTGWLKCKESMDIEHVTGLVNYIKEILEENSIYLENLSILKREITLVRPIRKSNDIANNNENNII